MKTNKKALSLLGTGHATTDMNQGALSMMLAFLQPVFALSQLQVGAAILAFNLSSSIIQPIFGIFSDRYRAAWLIPFGCLLAGLGMAATGFSPNYYLLLLAVFISGLGVAAYHPEGSKYARMVSGTRKASGMAIFSVGGNIGFAAGPILASFFVGLAGLSGSAGFALINGVMAFLIWTGLATVTGDRAAAPIESFSPPKTAAQKTEAPRTNNTLTFKYFFPVILLILVVIMRSWVHMGLVTFIPQYYVHFLHQSEALAATLTSLFLFGGVLGTLAGGPAADRWGLKTIISGSMFLMVLLLFIFTRLNGVWVPIIIFLIGFAVISTSAVTVVYCQEMLPRNVGLASGLILGFAIGMGGIGAILLGYVGDHWGLPIIFNVIIIFPVVGLLLSFFLPGQEKLARRAGTAS